MDPQTPPPPPPPPTSPPPPPHRLDHYKDEIVFFLASCTEALIAHAVKRGMKATKEKMMDGLAKDRITYREDFPDLNEIEMEQKLLRITARRMRWEPLMPLDEHPEMHDPFFHPYGLNLIYADELRPGAQRMLHERPPTWPEQPQRDSSPMNQDVRSRAPYHEDEEHRSRHLQPGSPSSRQQARKNKKRPSAHEGSPRASKRRKNVGGRNHSPSSRTSKANDVTAKEMPPRYGYDDKDRPYYSIYSDDISETYALFIGKSGMCIKPVEEHFPGLNFRVQRYEDIDRVVIWVEEKRIRDEKITPRTRERLRLAWNLLQAWADQVEIARKQRAENRDGAHRIPTIAYYLEKWKSFEETKQWPAVSKNIREPLARLEQVNED